MKKYLSVALIIVAVILVGCGNEKLVNQSTESIPSTPETKKDDKVDAILIAGSVWVLDSDNMPYLSDAVARNDMEYLRQLMIEGKVFQVDHDTKVERFGVTADKNNVLILFKEGRYTNKTGRTFAQWVYDEKEYSAYVKNRKETALSLIRQCLTSTENYSEIILLGSKEEINQLKEICFANRNMLGRQMENFDSNIAQCMKEAADINFERYNALFYCIQSIESKNNVSRDYYRSKIDSSCKKAEQLRQNFCNKYGF